MHLRLASDADVHGDMIRGLRRRAPAIDLARSQDALPEAAPDLEVLAWAATENRVLITNDDGRFRLPARGGGGASAWPDRHNQRAVHRLGNRLIAECMPEDELKNQVVVFLPFRG